MLTFNNLTFIKRREKEVQAALFFDNGYGVSVISGPAGCGLYGNINDNTFEVAAIKKYDNLKWDVVHPENTSFANDVCGWRTPEEITQLMEELQKL